MGYYLHPLLSLLANGAFDEIMETEGNFGNKEKCVLEFFCNSKKLRAVLIKRIFFIEPSNHPI